MKPVDNVAVARYNTSKMNNSKMEQHKMRFNVEIARTISQAYNVVCKPICKELDLPQTAFDILMFLGNNPKYKTAGEIVEVRRIKANLVSVNVDRLVNEGYLIRKPIEGDRRKTELVCTEKSQRIITCGREVQKAFFEKMFENIDDETRKAMNTASEIIRNNLKKISEEEDRK